MAGFVIGRHLALSEVSKVVEKKVICQPMKDLPRKSPRFANHEKATLFYIGASKKSLLCPYQKSKSIFFSQKCSLTNQRCTLI